MARINISPVAKMYYENMLDTILTRLRTINTKEKSKQHKGEIIMLKMFKTVLTNFLSQCDVRY